MIGLPRLPDEIRASLPPEVQAYLAALELTHAELQGRIAILEGTVAG